MIQPGDRVAVGVSGGKDSLLLLYALSLYRYVRHHDFTLQAIMLTSGKEKPDTSAIEALCGQLDVPIVIRHTEIYQILFEWRKEDNPCALCAKMRRGMLCDMSKDLGCNKLALGHHREDAEETLLMSVLYEARLHTFHPVTHMEDSGVTVIRPMVYAPEREIIHLAKKYAVPVVKNPCPADGHTTRQEMKDMLEELSRRYPRAKEYLLTALRDDSRYGLWNKTKP